MYAMGFWTGKFSEEEDVHYYHCWLNEGVPQCTALFGKDWVDACMCIEKCLKMQITVKAVLRQIKDVLPIATLGTKWEVTDTKKSQKLVDRVTYSWSKIERRLTPGEHIYICPNLLLL